VKKTCLGHEYWCFNAHEKCAFLYVVDFNGNKRNRCNMAHPLLIVKRRVKETFSEKIFGGEPAK